MRGLTVTDVVCAVRVVELTWTIEEAETAVVCAVVLGVALGCIAAACGATTCQSLSPRRRPRTTDGR